MDSDEFDVLEKKLEKVDTLEVDKGVAGTPVSDEDKIRTRSSKHKIDAKANNLDHRSKRARTRDKSPDYNTKRGSSRKRHLSPRDDGRDRDRDGFKSSRKHRDKVSKRRDGEERNRRDRDGERYRDGKTKKREKEKHRESYSDSDHERERDRESYHERHGEESDREKSKVREHKEREKDREYYHEYDSDHEREKDRENKLSHRRRSQRERHAEESDREKSKRTEHKEREREKERKERARENRSHIDREEEIIEVVDPEPDQRRPHTEEKEETAVVVDPERDHRTVFASQITLKANERDIFEFFSRAGQVRNVRLIMDRISRRSKGVGYIEFVDAMAVPMAIALSGQPLLGQAVMVKPSEAEKNLVQPTLSTAGATNGAIGPHSGGARRLYVGNLHLSMKEDQLRQVFEPFGIVEMVQLPTDPETGNIKGFGFVQFARLEDARAAECLDEQLEIAGHLIKVSAFTDQTLLDAGANTGDFDDDRGGGLTLNGSSRALLMHKLDRTGTYLRTVGSLAGAPILGITSPAPPVTVPSYDLIGIPSECLLLKNLFDPKIETELEFELDIKEDVKEECSRFGTIKHTHMDKESAGFVYLRFENTQAAMGAQRALHGRWFSGKMITATFMVVQNYESKFPDSR